MVGNYEIHTMWDALHAIASLTTLRSTQWETHVRVRRIACAQKWKGERGKYKRKKERQKQRKVVSIPSCSRGRLCQWDCESKQKDENASPASRAFLGASRPPGSGCKKMATSGLPSLIFLACLGIPTSNPSGMVAASIEGRKLNFHLMFR